MLGTKCEELANNRELQNIYRANLANELKYYPKTESRDREINFAFKCNSGCYAPIPNAGSLPYFLVEMKLVSVRNRTRFKAPDIFGRCRVMYFDSK
jgi:hypothetical protein